MRLTLDALLVLDAIDRRGSFSAAADELHRVPSAITYAVQKFEQDLDVKLFDRQGNRAMLTPAGRELLREGRCLLRAAAELEARTKRVATGWEAELRIAVDDLIPLTAVFPLVRAFYDAQCGTRMRLATEVLGGCWDALLSGRADLVIGAPGEGPAGGGYSTRRLGEIEWAFVVAPDHPLAQLPEPLQQEDLQRYRAVSSADSSRSLPPRTSGLIDGQEVLTVPDIHSKLAAQRLGLGVGYAPLHLIGGDLAAGRLVARAVEGGKPNTVLSLAWRNDHQGRALRWFLRELEKTPFARLLRADPFES